MSGSLLIIIIISPHIPVLRGLSISLPLEVFSSSGEKPAAKPQSPWAIWLQTRHCATSGKTQHDRNTMCRTYASDSFLLATLWETPEKHFKAQVIHHCPTMRKMPYNSYYGEGTGFFSSAIFCVYERDDRQRSMGRIRAVRDDWSVGQQLKSTRDVAV